MSITNSAQGDWRSAPKVKVWEQSLADAGCKLNSLKLLQGLYKRDGSLLFALVEANAQDEGGKPLLPYALLRGAAVVIVPCLEIEGTTERQFLMVRQRRIAHGRISLEFPAGMLDQKVDDAAGIALTELKEETGLVFRREDLVSLSDKALYSSPGLSDESIYYFACNKKMSAQEAQALHGSLMGAEHEGEFIHLALMDAKTALAETDSLQTTLGFELFFARYSELR